MPVSQSNDWFSKHDKRLETKSMAYVVWTAPQREKFTPRVFPQIMWLMHQQSITGLKLLKT